VGGPTLTREQLRRAFLMDGKPPGFGKLADFVAGGSHTEWLARALLAILDGTDANVALEVRPKRGVRGKGKASERDRTDWELAVFLAEHIDADRAPRSALKSAKEAAATQDRFKRFGPERMSYAWKKYRRSATLECSIRREFRPPPLPDTSFVEAMQRIVMGRIEALDTSTAERMRELVTTAEQRAAVLDRWAAAAAKRRRSRRKR
jgi:hypothetical protein